MVKCVSSGDEKHEVKPKRWIGSRGSMFSYLRLESERGKGKKGGELESRGLNRETGP